MVLSQEFLLLAIVAKITNLLMHDFVGFGMRHLGHLIQDKDFLNSQLTHGWLLGWQGYMAFLDSNEVWVKRAFSSGVSYYNYYLKSSYNIQ
jgi:hypothetical protein